MDSFGGQYLSASRQYLDLALSAASLASACRRQMDAVLAESGEEGLAGLSVEKFRTVVDREWPPLRSSPDSAWQEAEPE